MILHTRSSRSKRLTLRCVAAAGLVTLFGCGPDSPSGPANAARVVIDGHFEDWSDVPVAVTDPIDPSAVLCDFREFRVASSPSAVFFYLRLQHVIRLRVVGGTIRLYLDSDGDPDSGWREQGLPGVDVVFQSHPGESSLVTRDRAVGLRAWPLDASVEWSPRDTVERLGILSAPAYESARIEFRILRGVRSPHLADPLFGGTRVNAKLAGLLDDGTLVDETEPFSFSLVPIQPAERGTAPDPASDPLARAPGTRLRAVEWNVSHRTLSQRTAEILRILTALQPDLLLLNEVSDQVDPDSILELLHRIPSRDGSSPWRLSYGLGGGAERSAVASRVPLEELSEINDLCYPVVDLEHARGYTTPEQIRDIARQFQNGLSTAGAIVQVHGLRLLAVALGLESRGHRRDAFEERVRHLQARTIASAVEAVRARVEVDGVIVAGDFNLVVTTEPLDIVREGIPVGGSPLNVAEALQLDGASNETWSHPDVPFAPGRLDYLLYGAPPLRLGRTFVFASRDLSQRWLRYHGLHVEDSRLASDHFPVVADFVW